MADPPQPICAIYNQLMLLKRQMISKDSAYCNKVNILHKLCVKGYSAFTNPKGTLNIEEWKTKTSSKLYYCECESMCFVCKETIPFKK